MFAEKFLFVLAVPVQILIFSKETDAACSLPTELKNGQWKYTYTDVQNTEKTTTVTFGTTTISSGISVNALGTTIDEWNCISSLQISDTVSVAAFKSTKHYSDFNSGSRWLYMCMKFTKVSNDLFYFYLLSDVDTTIYPAERIYNPLVQPNQDGDICSTFCSYADSKPKIRTLEKEGTSDVLPDDSSLCEPCGDSCEKAPIVCTVSETVPFVTGPTNGSYNYLDKITYSCNIGYEVQSGNLERTCQDDGSWSGSPLVCAPIVCIVPETVEFSTGPTDGSYDYLDMITYSCNTGYEVQSGNLERSCQDDKTWSGSPPVCAPIVCIVPETVEFATGPTDGSYNYLDMITYSCNTGYEVQSGNLERSCQDDKTWSGSPPVCAPIVCIVPETVEFATGPTDGSYNYLDMITYSCNTGYEVQSGNLERSCQDDKTWSGSPPVCAPIVCIVPETVEFATGPTDGSYNYLDMITYSCNTGYEVQSGNLERSCQDDKTWSGSPPVCAPIVCIVPETVEFATGPSYGSYNYLDLITYSCNTGYEVQSGDVERSCQDDKTWGGSPPVCVPVSCPGPGNGQFTEEQTYSSYSFSETITYSCIKGYKIQSGDLIRSCQADGTWSGSSPVCKMSLEYFCATLFELFENEDSLEIELDNISSEGSFEKNKRKKYKDKKKKKKKGRKEYGFFKTLKALITNNCFPS
ncbi:sushi, von Willebrand factor type A, EGF and pentraxin domain-containing protein 1-like isoform X2 [Mytilus californianus]|uniref:sushi, von Willebrand factor type A, EGF and pentraxin domain-containing protein 1-like isoform X2 n=1 Tax=Mytilus californianus TaxID=6549 RepID=UPI002245EFF2|nr:sushi, von Willebrand factor type A, EGF and pentraxin domain-containing protein 1-like isoform X2 [Mytilus californianus]